MKSKIWCKTILSIYRYLSRICDSIDKIFQSQATSMIGCHSTLFSLNSSEKTACNLIELTEKKIALINLKLLIENALWNMDRTGARLLIKKFIDGAKGDEICEIMGLPERTYFRKVGVALDSFEHALFRLGYDSLRIENMLCGQKWIEEVYSSLEENENSRKMKNETETFVLDDRFFSKICSRLSKISLFN